MPELDGPSLASALEPQLRHACRGRLGKVSWFKADWQHGGAGTGFSTWKMGNSRDHKGGSGREIPCVVKLPIGYTEYFWTKRLGLVRPEEWDDPRSCTLPTPRVLAAGFELEGYDLAWIVMERFANPPMAAERTTSAMWAIFRTAAEFHAAAILEQPVDPTRMPPQSDWVGHIETGLAALEANAIENRRDWINALTQTREVLDTLVDRWRGREIDTWCHHDLHPHNAMRRIVDEPGANGHCALIDLALVAPGSWIEDALYMERLFWGRPDQLCDIDPLTTLAATRSSIGLPADEEAIALADVRRVLMAACAPAFLRTECDPVYLKAALGMIERLLPRLIG